MGKYFSNNDLFKVLRLTDELLIKTSVHFCLGLPTENLETYNDYEQIVNKISFENNYATVAYPITYIIDPNCPMAKNPRKYGIKLFFKNFEDYNLMSSNIGKPQKPSSGYETKDLKNEDIIKLNIMARNHISYINSFKRLKGF